jgi:DNA-binding transcriptional ArsR family regulator
MSAALDATLRAVADPTRRKILGLLEAGPQRAGDIAVQFPRLSRPAVSRHLRVLRKAGLVGEAPPTSDSDAREVWYIARPEPLYKVEQWVAHYRRFWRDRLDDLAGLAERRKQSP